MSPFDNISFVKESLFPLKKYYCLINLFQIQAKKFKDNIYFRYEAPSVEGGLEVRTLTYGQVDLITTNLACELYDKLGKEPVISVLEDHSVYYPILLYALYKLRVPVQMISIRNTPATVCNLLKQADSHCLVFGSSYLHVKEIVSKEIGNAKCFPVPEIDIEELLKNPLNHKWSQILNQEFTEEDMEKTVAIIHSSGTTNTPKIVVWSNRFIIYFIQSLPNTFYKRKQLEFMEDENDILFGITPSFHMFGSYTNHQCILSGSSIYFCKSFPPTAKHTIDVIKRENITRLNTPPYFINQIMHYIQETGDVGPFQRLKYIVTGGATTPKIIDDFYLDNKINVLNMLGMSECFNLFISEVSLKRIDSNTYFYMEDGDKHSYLEHFDGDNYQIIIKNGSPFQATGVENRENGDYATNDLVTRSKTVKEGYYYAGRTDDTLAMITGEKINPSAMEDTIRTSPLVSNCTIIGEGRQCTAALIELRFETIKDYCLETVMEEVYEIVRKANKVSPSRSAIILREMIMIIPLSKHLIASDKGTVSRNRSIAYFQKEVDAMYAKFLERSVVKLDI